MTRIAAIIVALVAFSPAGYAQVAWSDTILCWGGAAFSACGKSHHAPTGDADLDRAVAICDAHPNAETNMTPVWPPYASGWQACDTIYRFWGVSAAAIKERERQKKEAEDKAFVDALGAKLEGKAPR